MTKHKRLKMAATAFGIFTVLGFVGYLVHPEHISGLAIFFGAVSLPILGYITGETIRPSK